MVSLTLLAIFEVVGIFVFGMGISWLLFRILQTKLKHTPQQTQDKHRPVQAEELKVEIQQSRLETLKTKQRTEELRLLALQARADVMGRGHNGSNDSVDNN